MGATSDRSAGMALLLAGACLLLLGGCGGSDADSATTPATSTQPAQDARPLPAAWYEDPDGDLVSTAVEREIETDPMVDECVQAQGCGDVRAADTLEQSNTLLILDSSGSMAGSAGGGTSKLAAAKQALRRYVAGTPDSIELGFMVFGHKGTNEAGSKAASCAGIELLDPIGEAASERFDRTLNRFKPRGYTALGAALREARAAFAGREDDINRIILVTDGVDTCGGDPVAEARKLKRAGIKVTTDVVGFDVAKPDEARRLRAIAEASGGTYTDARSASALQRYFDNQRELVSDLAKNLLCVMDKAARVSLCQQDTAARGSLYMDRAVVEASTAGREAQAAEIERLDKELDAAAERRDEEHERRSAVTERRVRREYEEADRRLERLNR